MASSLVLPSTHAVHVNVEFNIVFCLVFFRCCSRALVIVQIIDAQVQFKMKCANQIESGNQAHEWTLNSMTNPSILQNHSYDSNNRWSNSTCRAAFNTTFNKASVGLSDGPKHGLSRAFSCLNNGMTSQQDKLADSPISGHANNVTPGMHLRIGSQKGKSQCCGLIWNKNRKVQLYN